MCNIEFVYIKSVERVHCDKTYDEIQCGVAIVKDLFSTILTLLNTCIRNTVGKQV